MTPIKPKPPIHPRKGISPVLAFISGGITAFAFEHLLAIRNPARSHVERLERDDSDKGVER